MRYVVILILLSIVTHHSFVEAVPVEAQTSGERSALCRPMLPEDVEFLGFPSDIFGVDSDWDRLPDAKELEIGSNPILWDSDGDGIGDGGDYYGAWGYVAQDGTMVRYETNPTLVDTDQDQIHDDDEITTTYSVALNIYYHTNPTKSDTDGDFVRDNIELTGSRGYFTHPAMADTDCDELPDGT